MKYALIFSALMTSIAAEANVTSHEFIEQIVKLSSGKKICEVEISYLNAATSTDEDLVMAGSFECDGRLLFATEILPIAPRGYFMEKLFLSFQKIKWDINGGCFTMVGNTESKIKCGLTSR